MIITILIVIIILLYFKICVLNFKESYYKTKLEFRDIKDSVKDIPHNIIGLVKIIIMD